MSIFDTIKDSVTCKEIAYKYLGKPDKTLGDRLWYKSPFRPETAPSFMVTDCFHDFGENWHGDGIDLVSRLYNINTIQACRLIARDFNLPVNTYESDYIVQLKAKEREEKRKAQEQLELWFNITFIKLCNKLNELVVCWKHLKKYPVGRCYIQSDIDYLSYIIDKFINSKTTEEKLFIYKGRGVIEKWIY